MVTRRWTKVLHQPRIYKFEKETYIKMTYMQRSLKRRQSFWKTLLNHLKLMLRLRQLKLVIWVHPQAKTCQKVRKSNWLATRASKELLHSCHMISDNQILWIIVKDTSAFSSHSSKFPRSISNNCSNLCIFLNNSKSSHHMLPILPRLLRLLWYLVGGRTCPLAGQRNYLMNWLCQGATTSINSTSIMLQVCKTQPTAFKWSIIHKVLPSPPVLLVATITSWQIVYKQPRWPQSHFKLRTALVPENQTRLQGTSYLRFSWPMSQSGSPCSSSIYSLNLSRTSPSTEHPLTMRWRTSILIFSYTYFIWRVQKRHWRGITMRRSWNCFVIIDSMGHSWSPWIKTKPLMNWSVSLLPTCSSLRQWTAIFKTRASRMTSYPNVCSNSAVSTRNWTKSTHGRSATSSSCSFTNQVGVQQKKIAMIQRVAYMHTIRVIFADHQTCLNMRLRTARPFRMARDGSTVHAVLSATNATQRSRGCIILTNIRG